MKNLDFIKMKNLDFIKMKNFDFIKNRNIGHEIRMTPLFAG